MYRYTFPDGMSYTTNLKMEEFIKRLNRLDTLRVICEGYDEGTTGDSIYKKALRAWSKTDNFTGVIHLTFSEKDWLSYKREGEFNRKETNEVIDYYLRH